MEKIIGNCKHCGERIRWIPAPDGNPLPVNAETKEVHFPDCGKEKWIIPHFSALEWAEYLEDVAKKIRKKNSVKIRTGETKKNLYTGKTPPWEFPTFIRCIE